MLSLLCLLEGIEKAVILLNVYVKRIVIAVYVIIFILLCFGKAIKAEQMTIAKVEASTNVTVKVTLKDYFDKPIQDASVKVTCDHEGVIIVPQKDPKNTKVHPSVTNEKGEAFFSLQVPESGAITLTVSAQRLPEVVSLPRKLLQQALHIFVKPRKGTAIENNIMGNIKLILEVRS